MTCRNTKEQISSILFTTQITRLLFFHCKMVKTSSEFSTVKGFSHPSVSSTNTCIPYNFKRSNNKNIIASLIWNNISETESSYYIYYSVTIFNQETFSEHDSRVIDLQQSTLQKVVLPQSVPLFCMYRYLLPISLPNENLLLRLYP